MHMYRKQHNVVQLQGASAPSTRQQGSTSELLEVLLSKIDDLQSSCNNTSDSVLQQKHPHWEPSERLINGHEIGENFTATRRLKILEEFTVKAKKHKHFFPSS